MTGVDVPDEVLRPGLELAFVVAVLGTRQRPPIPAAAVPAPVPALPEAADAALVPVRKVVEEDEAFRARVAAVATEAGRPPAVVAVAASPRGLGSRSWRRWPRPRPRPDGQGSPKAQARRAEATEAKVRRLSAELAVLRDEVDRAQDGRQRAEAGAGEDEGRSGRAGAAAERARIAPSRPEHGHCVAGRGAAGGRELARAEAEELRRRPAPAVEAAAGLRRLGARLRWRPCRRLVEAAPPRGRARWPRKARRCARRRGVGRGGAGRLPAGPGRLLRPRLDGARHRTVRSHRASRRRPGAPPRGPTGRGRVRLHPPRRRALRLPPRHAPRHAGGRRLAADPGGGDGRGGWLQRGQAGLAGRRARRPA